MASSNIITKAERDRLFKNARIQTGKPLNTEIDDDDMEMLLQNAIEDISEYINTWLIEQQWVTLLNLGLSTADITFALTTKTLDFETSFTHAYSKQVGLGTTAPSEWELKQDYIIVSGNTQVYSIPANREVNEVLWFTAPDLTLGGGFGASISGVDNNVSFIASPTGAFYGGREAQYMQPASTLILQATDASIKNKILKSELTYRITAGPNGTKNLWLYPIPGSNLEISGWNGKHYEGSKVFYYYYDTNNKNRNKCLEENNDIIKLPSDVSIKKLTWGALNEPYKVKVRKLLIAYVKKTLGIVRGRYSGEIPSSAGNTLLKMDYQFLITEGENEAKEVMEGILNSLLRITLKTLMEDRASIAENLNKTLGFVPMNMPITLV